MVKFGDVRREIDVRSANALINFFIVQKRFSSTHEFYETPLNILAEYERKELMRSKNFGKASVARLEFIMNKNGIYFKNESEYDKINVQVENIESSIGIIKQKLLDVRSKEDFFSMHELNKAFDYLSSLSIINISKSDLKQIQEMLIARIKQSKKQ